MSKLSMVDKFVFCRLPLRRRSRLVTQSAAEDMSKLSIVNKSVVCRPPLSRRLWLKTRSAAQKMIKGVSRTEVGAPSAHAAQAGKIRPHGLKSRAAVIMHYGLTVKRHGTAARFGPGYCHTDYASSFPLSLTSHVGDNDPPPHNQDHKQRNNKRAGVSHPTAQTKYGGGSGARYPAGHASHPPTARTPVASARTSP